jgi:glycosyltransferase involved in cell wall biosynthesis
VTTATVDMAGGTIGGAGRYRAEVWGYLERSARDDIKIIGARRRLSAAWLATREAAAVRRSRRISFNNVGFLTPGGERWTLLSNALHFLTGPEMATLDPGLRAAVSRQARVVHGAARRSDVLIAPCTAMAGRITAALPGVADRVVVRMHPVFAGSVSAGPVPTRRPDEPLILCPVLFAPYKHMADRLAEWLAAADEALDDSVRMIVTADAAQVPARLAASPRLRFAGPLGLAQLTELRARSRALYFPTGLESFGWPLAEARVYGKPVIARDTAQNREIAGSALRGFIPGDPDSLRQATESALAARVSPDPAPFEPGAYFDWLLGAAR